jgi:predicted XRE-type DNA-binding protein
VTRGGKNVFRDVGFADAEAKNLRHRADLVIALTDLIEQRRWTQAFAASAMGVTQPRISDLKRGKLARFSLDMLVQMLNRAGAEVRISVVTRRSHASRTDCGGPPIRLREVARGRRDSSVRNRVHEVHD